MQICSLVLYAVVLFFIAKSKPIFSPEHNE